LGGFGGSTLARLLDEKTPDYWNAISSLGSLGAAIATFLTVREMQAARRLTARARIGLKGSDSPVRFVWNLSKNILALPDGNPVIAVRNSSSGIATSVIVKWLAVTKITDGDISSINRLLGDGREVHVAPSAYEILFTGEKPDSLPIAGSFRSVAGDIGPAQDQDVAVPTVIVHYAVIKWMSLLEKSLANVPIAAREVPRFQLEFSHSNPYDREVVDSHQLRFVMVHLLISDSRGKELSFKDWSKVASVEATIVPEIWIDEVAAPATVLVGG
jgi:hypothetical protein